MLFYAKFNLLMKAKTSTIDASVIKYLWSSSWYKVSGMLNTFPNAYYSINYFIYWDTLWEVFDGNILSSPLKIVVFEPSSRHFCWDKTNPYISANPIVVTPNCVWVHSYWASAISTQLIQEASRRSADKTSVFSL